MEQADTFALYRMISAWVRNRIEIAMTPPGGEPKRRSGYALTIPSKGQHARWRLASDAKAVS